MGGVDKRRYRRKPKGLVWRIFWSSLPRRLFVSFFFLYLAVYHVLVPLGMWILQETILNGPIRSGTTAGIPSESAILASLVHGPRFDALATIQRERKYLNQLQSEREAVEEHGYQNLLARWRVLEQIDPEWFHRFDQDIVYRKNTLRVPKSNKSEDEDEDEDDSTKDRKDTKHKTTQAPQQHNDKVKLVDTKNDKTSPKENSNPKPSIQTATTKPIQKTNNKKRYHQLVDKSQQTANYARHLMVTGGIYIPDEEFESKSEDTDTNQDNLMLPLRSLHNMESLGADYSSCGCGGRDSTTPIGTTLVTQTSIDRLWIVQETCSHRWTTDPMVALVFVPHFAEEEPEQTLNQELEKQSSKLLNACPNLTLVRYEADHIESLQGRYPVNRLRNVGLDLVQTSHVLVMDVDLVPSRDLGIIVKNALQKTNNNNNNNNNNNDDNIHKALVVPAFEKKAPKSCDDATDPALCMSKFLQENGAFLPRTFDELKECYESEEKDCVVFQSEYNWDGHSTTRSDRWIKKDWYEDNDSKTNFKRIPCFHTARYEPYVVIEWCPIIQQSSSNNNSNNNSENNPSRPISPYYDERFYGYGKNKIELVSHLRRSNVKFEVLPEGFLVHNPHPESSTKETWLNKDHTNDLHATMDALYVEFLHELDIQYKSVHEESIKLCERKTNK